MTSLYLKLGAGLLLVLAIFGGGWKVGSGHWQSKYDSLVAEDWKAKAVGEAVARKAVEQRYKQLRDISESNAQVLRDLQDQTASVVADRDRVRKLADRLLHRPQACPDSAGVPEASRESRTPETSQAGSDAEVRELLVAAHDECIGNANSLDALISQLQPQL